MHQPDGRDRMIQIGKDLRRTVDYLLTREDLDNDRLPFYGLSWGAGLGPVMTAIEPRFEASELLAGGLWRPTADWHPDAVLAVMALSKGDMNAEEFYQWLRISSAWK